MTLRHMEQPLYDTLHGNWYINREIDDRYSEQKGKFVGTAAFTRQNTGLLYNESGDLTFGETSLRASRAYQWSFDGLSVQVTYEDGSPFHDFTLDGSTAQAKHLCGQDIYYAKYDFYLPSRWTAVWTVSGPRKDYTSTSTYIR